MAENDIVLVYVRHKVIKFYCYAFYVRIVRGNCKMTNSTQKTALTFSWGLFPALRFCKNRMSLSFSVIVKSLRKFWLLHSIFYWIHFCEEKVKLSCTYHSSKCKIQIEIIFYNSENETFFIPCEIRTSDSLQVDLYTR